MKILTGKYFQKPIPVVGRTRPPLCRIRQSIFDILSDRVENATILDLCAGSGSFGLEALSRGAKFAYFVEENINTARNLLNTLKTWGAENAKVIIKNVQYLPNTDQKMDLIFFDPPFGHNYIEMMQTRVVKKGWVHDQTMMMIRYNEEVTHEHPFWNMVQMKRIGKSYIHFYVPKSSYNQIISEE